MKRRHPIDNLFRRALAERAAPAPPGLFAAIQQKRQARRSRRRLRRILGGLLLLLLLAGTGAGFYRLAQEPPPPTDTRQHLTPSPDPGGRASIPPNGPGQPGPEEKNWNTPWTPTKQAAPGSSPATPPCPVPNQNCAP